ncbi:ribonuclease HII [Bacillus sp. FJAT-49736]|uniref:ribonuclease HII n=1 Tax=Bacillus sp. FJAT-49736 TaxID=2833582 RepID=UPI001BC9B458|nr:ribonuclease HII [Bacillus sp. FJAT-49736]MBS4172498.1 ribonuclease HII [Bacillus sp. FJAT-49736]
MVKLTIKEIAEQLQSINHLNHPFLEEMKKDTRKGVQSLIKKKYEAIKKLELEREQFFTMMQYENAMKLEGFNLIAGIDEVGRGPLAGPVVAAAVILPEHFYLGGINDSKQLTEQKRDEFYNIILDQAAIGVGIISAEEIDRINIYEATKKAMLAALNDLSVFPDYCLIDAMKLTIPVPQTSIIKGDAKSISIAAASIVAKVTRDRMMKRYSEKYPQYHFESNMGYGTKEHIDALHTYGPCPIHRKTFAPIKEMV